MKKQVWDQILSKKIKLNDKIPTISFLSERTMLSYYFLRQVLSSLETEGKIRKEGKFYRMNFSIGDTAEIIQQRLAKNSKHALLFSKLYSDSELKLETATKYYFINKKDKFITYVNLSTFRLRKINIKAIHNAFTHRVHVRDVIANPKNMYLRNKYTSQMNIINIIKPVYSKLKLLNIGI